ncbi:MAG TPA: LytTR family transcriptional regulator DNA-binding domain-containing protein [Pelobium sp.]
MLNKRNDKAMRILVIGQHESTYNLLVKALPKLTDKPASIEKIYTLKEAKEWLSINKEPDLLVSEVKVDTSTIFNFQQNNKVFCPIILVASTAAYAMRAFEMNTIDYLLKPLTQKSLLKALQKFFLLKKSYLTASSTDVYKDRFFVSLGNKVLYLMQDEVCFFFSEDKVVYIFTTDGRRYVFDHTLNSLETMLDPKLYFRISRQVLVKLNCINTIKKHDSRRLNITLASGGKNYDFVISRNRVQAFKSWIGK